MHRIAAQRDVRPCRFVVDTRSVRVCEPAFSGKADLGDDPEPGKRSIIFSTGEDARSRGTRAFRRLLVAGSRVGLRNHGNAC